jgi:membrane protease YdiL (CAAX protease family)
MHAILKFSSYIASISRAPAARYSLVPAVAWIPAQALGVLFSQLFPGGSQGSLFASPFYMILGGLLLAPLLETIAMKYMFIAGAKRIPNPVHLNIICSILWGIAHFSSPGFGIHAVWAFFVFGACYQELARRSEDYAVINVATIHIIFNAVSYLAYTLLD